MKLKNFQLYKFSSSCITPLESSIFPEFKYVIGFHTASFVFLYRYYFSTRLTTFFCRQTERSKEMNFAADCTSAIFFKRNVVNIKPNTYSNSAKEEDSKYLGFDMLKITEDKDAIFHLHFSSFSFINFTKICCSKFSSLLWLSNNTKFILEE